MAVAVHPRRSQVGPRQLHQQPIEGLTGAATCSSSRDRRRSRCRRICPPASRPRPTSTRGCRDRPVPRRRRFIYQLDASRDYNPEPRLGAITAPLIWINSGDDFINPPELSGIARQLVRRIPHGQVHPDSGVHEHLGSRDAHARRGLEAVSRRAAGRVPQDSEDDRVMADR